jgi:Ca2+-binding EF-hand superfamily protein
MGELGVVNEAFKKLKKEVEKFFKEYDDDENGEIDVNELKEKRTKLAQELEEKEESKLWKVVNALKDLENIVVDYRQGVPDDEIERKVEVVKLLREIIGVTDIVEEIEDAVINFQKEINELCADGSKFYTIEKPVDKVEIRKLISNLGKVKID